MGSLAHPLSSLLIEGSVTSDGDNFNGTAGVKKLTDIQESTGPGGGSGGTILLFVHTMALRSSAILSSAGGYSLANGSGGGGGGRIHFHWADIPTGDVYQPIASVKGHIGTRFVHLTILSSMLWCSFLNSGNGTGYVFGNSIIRLLILDFGSFRSSSSSFFLWNKKKPPHA